MLAGHQFEVGHTDSAVQVLHTCPVRPGSIARRMPNGRDNFGVKHSSMGEQLAVNQYVGGSNPPALATVKAYHACGSNPLFERCTRSPPRQECRVFDRAVSPSGDTNEKTQRPRGPHRRTHGKRFGARQSVSQRKQLAKGLATPSVPPRSPVPCPRRSATAAWHPCSKFLGASHLWLAVLSTNPRGIADDLQTLSAWPPSPRID